jgi:hypothetical protein
MWAIVVVAVVVFLVVVGFVASAVRRRALRARFGPEYERTRREKGRFGTASELSHRRNRRKQLDIVPLSSAARERYAVQWRSVQASFVDRPSGAVRDADALVMAVLQERGYPMDNFEQRSADISVDHPHVVDNYRTAHAISLANDRDQADTEDLRQAMVHYRALFEELLEDATPDRRVG